MTITDTDRLRRRLDEKDRRHGNPRLFEYALMLGRMHLGLPIGLVVDGQFMRGSISSPEVFAKSVDAQVAELLNAMPNTDNPYSQMLGYAEKALADEKEKQTAAMTRLAEQYEGSFASQAHKFSDNEFADFLDAITSDSYFCLEDVLMRVSGDWVRIDRMQVAVSSVSAWWPMQEEQGINIQYRVNPSQTDSD